MNTQTTYLASKPHYEILDGLRGVAAVMVIIFHLFEAHAGGSHLTQIINHAIWQWISFSCSPVLLSVMLMMTVGTG